MLESFVYRLNRERHRKGPITLMLALFATIAVVAVLYLAAPRFNSRPQVDNDTDQTVWPNSQEINDGASVPQYALSSSDASPETVVSPSLADSELEKLPQEPNTHPTELPPSPALNAPLQYSEVLENPKLRPANVSLHIDKVVPLKLNGEEVGEKTISKGTDARLIAMSPEGILSLDSHGTRFDMNYGDTDLLARATELRAAIFNAAKIQENIEAKTDASEKHQIIPGIYAVDVYGNLTEKGFTLKREYFDDLSYWKCSRDDGVVQYTVEIYGNGPSEIISIRATVIAPPSIIDEHASDFLGYLATVSFEGNSRAESKAWVQQNISKKASRLQNGVLFETLGSAPGARMLQIRAEAE